MDITNHRSKLLQDLDDEILERQQKVKKLEEELNLEKGEISRLAEARNILTHTGSETKKTELRPLDLDFPGYPKNGSLLDKFKYFEDKDHKMWRKKDMENSLRLAEGPDGAALIKHLSSKLHYYADNGQLITMSYNGANLYSFYTSKFSWINISPDGYHTVKKEHAPSEELLQRLSPEQRDVKKIKWKGIKLKK